jgi:hypoxanthine-DNA glycosylase
MTDRTMTDQAFEPVADARCRVLVLGSFPGVRSLQERRYYAHPRNQFWQLMSPVVGVDLVPLGYADRLAALVARGIGLWDVVGTARRAGSLDAALRDVATRDLRALAGRLPLLAAMAFNGGAAFRIGQRQLGPEPGLALVALPSSSAAYTLPLAAKLAAWSRLADWCQSSSPSGPSAPSSSSSLRSPR